MNNQDQDFTRLIYIFYAINETKSPLYIKTISEPNKIKIIKSLEDHNQITYKGRTYLHVPGTTVYLTVHEPPVPSPPNIEHIKTLDSLFERIGHPDSEFYMRKIDEPRKLKMIKTGKFDCDLVSYLGELYIKPKDKMIIFNLKESEF